MSAKEKLIRRFKEEPKDFTWKEMLTLMKSLGFVELQGKGSRVKFYHKPLECLICLHRPHPSNILKPYMIRQILQTLEEQGII